jgi:hypothetical protein
MLWSPQHWSRSDPAGGRTGETPQPRQTDADSGNPRRRCGALYSYRWLCLSGNLDMNDLVVSHPARRKDLRPSPDGNDGSSRRSNSIMTSSIAVEVPNCGSTSSSNDQSSDSAIFICISLFMYSLLFVLQLPHTRIHSACSRRCRLHLAVTRRAGDPIANPGWPRPILADAAPSGGVCWQ